MKNYISESLASGIITPSKSPVAAGFFFVTKKDGSLRPCIDYRHLNNITIKNKYPLPLLNASFEPLAPATIFTKLDLRNAYHLVRIKKGDEWKTAFNTHLGHYEYKVMPFGLTNAPAVFQTLVNDILRDMLDQFVVVYLDDILIFSRNPQEHQQHVRLVLQRLLENRLFVKAEKCCFHASSVDFLGFIVERGHVRADRGKVKAVVAWPQPASRTELRRFLGFAGFYRRFIRNFSRIAAPLNALTSSKVNFLWLPEADRAFSGLKTSFVSAPVLIHPDWDCPFLVEVGASDSGIGAILSQRSKIENLLHPCAFFSRRLSPAELNYDAGNRELLAIHEALVEWRHWLEGAKHQFQILTDHSNLLAIRSARRINNRQARWQQFFSRFDYILSYRPGFKNQKADALSRVHIAENTCPTTPETILPSTRIVGMVSWRVEDQVKKALQARPGPGSGPPGKLFVHRELRLQQTVTPTSGWPPTPSADSCSSMVAHSVGLRHGLSRI
ncbi:dehydrogenase/reductase (SDR family) member 7Cb isoform X2 [Entelurus aequoreus]|uniref:dehydrogenase/reductase (SDR family) member 7Cb isoform X2 n=1 Tax=Entelurus aequoreus TaxID=161455 RepID=UPI002B1E88A2|nr:dehydrogenase/reductase (SDR family) member 7Cb isoform X2 [Entelurus aequoreus]